MDFDTQFGYTGMERVTTAIPAPAGSYFLIVPQGTTPVVIDSITLVPGFSASNLDNTTITSPRYVPFTALTLTSGEADIYKGPRERVAQGKLH